MNMGLLLVRLSVIQSQAYIDESKKSPTITKTWKSPIQSGAPYHLPQDPQNPIAPHSPSLLNPNPPPPAPSPSAFKAICPPTPSCNPPNQPFNFPQAVADFLPLAMKIVRSLRPSGKSKTAGSGRTSKAKSSRPAASKSFLRPDEVKPWCLIVWAVEGAFEEEFWFCWLWLWP